MLAAEPVGMPVSVRAKTGSDIGPAPIRVLAKTEKAYSV